MAAPQSKKAVTEVVGTAAEKVMFRTTSKSSILFDIQIYGEPIYGQWSAEQGIVEFHVPPELVDGLKLHYHFVSGNIEQV